ncbi:hypothetical protein F4778DRAFT_782527 [Xylariomycetidae sp. FL2044]|nr:hypothetical protein F4778DRAFT_782527 [Xylariomycetidae sp. FL2044]
MASKSDYQVAALAAGFTLGFGFLTVWEAMKQTGRNKNPTRSLYIYMIWGEIAANVVIGILAWLFLDGILSPSVPVFFFILLCWVFEIQLLMQIIINRIAVISEKGKRLTMIKWGTVTVITLINIAVFCVFIPAHLTPPPSQALVIANQYWDKLSKVLICFVDAGLNWYFVRIVKKRLLEQHGLKKYAPLVSFNTKLLVVSVAMDLLLIGLMFLPNQIVFIQFHPVTYMVKLNIEMTMADLIAKLARGEHNSSAYDDVEHGSYGQHDGSYNRTGRSVGLQSFASPKVEGSQGDPESHMGGIHKRMDVTIHSEQLKRKSSTDQSVSFSSVEDEMSLTHHAGHPRGVHGADMMDGRNSSGSIS